MEKIYTVNCNELEKLYKSVPIGVCTKDCPCIKFRQTQVLNGWGRIFAGKYGHKHCIQFIYENENEDVIDLLNIFTAVSNTLLI